MSGGFFGGAGGPVGLFELPDYGYGPMTPQSRDGRMPRGEMRAATPEAFLHPALAALLTYGPMPAQMAVDVAKQPVRAGEALGSFAALPSIPTATNAAVQSALVFPTARGMKAAIGATGAGYGAAAATDFGLFGSAAHAAKSKRKDVSTPDLPGLTAEENAAYKEITGRLTRQEYTNRGERNALEKQAEVYTSKASSIGAAGVASDSAKKKAEQDEYNRAVLRAETERDAILSTDKSFKDSSVGRLYETTGGFAPMLMGAAGGMVHRLANGSTGPFHKYLMPAVEGSALTFAGLNAPYIYDALSAPVKNPQREAAYAYGAELPAGHPGKQDALDRAASPMMPHINPVSSRAWEELTSLPGMARRAATAVIEGGPAGLFGANLPAAARRTVEGIGEIPGAIATSYHRGTGRAANARQAAAEAGLVASEARAAADEARRRSSSTMGDYWAPPGGSQGLAGQQPTPLVATNQVPYQPPSLNGMNLQPSPMEIKLGDTERQMVEDLLSRMSGPSGVQQRSFPPQQSSMASADLWERYRSPAARDIVAEHAGQGGTLVKGARAKDGGLSVDAFDSAVKDRTRHIPELAGKGPGKPESARRLDALRAELERMGVPLNASRQQIEEALAKIDPRIFAVPAAVGAGVGANSIWGDTY